MAVESRLGRALELAEALPVEERLVLIDLLQRRLADERREEIAANASETLQAVRSGMATMGHVTDLRAILEDAK